ncbi:MAG: T9SS type A sorting domain-containing protein [Bacteroidota bacterium]
MLACAGLFVYTITPATPEIEPLDEATLARFEAKLKKGPKSPHDQPAEAQQFYAEQRVAGGGPLPLEKYEAAKQQLDAMDRYSLIAGRRLTSTERRRSTYVWGGKGPGNIGGRTRAMLIDPGTPATMYAAGVAGGIFKSTNAGASWTPTSDLAANLAVVSMVMDPNDSNTIYAGTGEGAFNADAVRGNGILKTTDGGTTWTQLASTNNDSDFYYVMDLVISPNDSDVVYAATRTGVHKSTDAGATWSRVYNPSGSNSRCLDLKIRTDLATDNLLVGCGTFSSGLLARSTDAGATWTTVLSETNQGRTEVAIAPSDQSIMYAVAASTASGSYNNGLLGVWRSTDGGATWTNQVSNTDGTKLNTTLLSNTVFAYLADCSFGPSNQFINQGWYDIAIAVDPINADRVWVAGIDNYVSTNAGEDWALASHWWTSGSQNVHADNHNFIFHPDYNGTSNQTMYAVNDGGVYRTNAATSGAGVTALANICGANGTTFNWTDLNTDYGVTQFYDGIHYPDGATYFGGTQDNGTIRGTDGGGSNAWSEINGGDGGYVAVDPTNTDVLFAETTNLSISKSTNGGANFSAATTGITEASSNFQFINPFLMDPNNPQILWTGGYTLWRTDNQAGSWTQASPTNLTGGGGNSIAAWAVAPGNSDLVLAGDEAGNIYRNTSATTANSSSTWTDVASMGGFVSSIAFDPQDANTAYATVSTFGATHLWQSTDGGASWSAFGSGLPDIPFHSVAVSPADSDVVIVGTDLGILVTENGGASFAVENTGFANTPVEKLSIRTATTGANGKQQQSSFQVFAFTHGRSMSSASISSPLPVELASFEARVQGGDVVLEWVTATETSNAGFAVEMRSEACVGENCAFQEIDFVEGAGTTDESRLYAYTVADPGAGRYTFRLRQVDFDGAFEYSPEVEATVTIPDTYQLSEAYPNPFNPSATMSLTMATTQAVTAKLYDTQGRLVRSVFAGTLSGQQSHTLRIDGASLASGTYLLHVKGAEFQATRKLTLAK